jgi:hypothetical protein
MSMDFNLPDPLTGLLWAPRTIPAGARFGAVVWIDIDHLKPLNDEHGHRLGDLIIAVVAHAIATASPHPTYRAGGDEFAVTIPTHEAHQAAHVADAIREAVAIADRLPPMWPTECTPRASNPPATQTGMRAVRGRTAGSSTSSPSNRTWSIRLSATPRSALVSPRHARRETTASDHSPAPRGQRSARPEDGVVGGD